MGPTIIFILIGLLTCISCSKETNISEIKFPPQSEGAEFSTQTDPPNSNQFAKIEEVSSQRIATFKAVLEHCAQSLDCDNRELIPAIQFFAGKGDMTSVDSISSIALSEIAQPEYRAAAARGLSELGARPDISVRLIFSNNAPLPVRISAMEGFVRIQNNYAVAIAIFQNVNNDVGYRMAAADLLAENKIQSYPTVLLNALESTEDDIGASLAAFALRNQTDEVTTSSLLAVIKDRTKAPVVRSFASYSLHTRELQSSVVNALATVLRDEDESLDVRSQIAMALGYSKSSGPVPLLESLSQRNDRLGTASALALQALGTREFKTPGEKKSIGLNTIWLERALNDQEKKIVRDAVFPLLKDESNEVAVQALDVLTRAKVLHLDDLPAVLSSPNSSCFHAWYSNGRDSSQYILVELFKQIGEEAVVPLLLNELRSSHLTTAASIIEFLKLSSTLPAVAEVSIRTYLRDVKRNPYLDSEAIRLLLKLRGTLSEDTFQLMRDGLVGGDVPVAVASLGVLSHFGKLSREEIESRAFEIGMRAFNGNFHSTGLAGWEKRGRVATADSINGAEIIRAAALARSEQAVLLLENLLIFGDVRDAILAAGSLKELNALRTDHKSFFFEQFSNQLDKIGYVNSSKLRNEIARIWPAQITLGRFNRKDVQWAENFLEFYQSRSWSEIEAALSAALLHGDMHRDTVEPLAKLLVLHSEESVVFLKKILQSEYDTHLGALNWSLAIAALSQFDNPPSLIDRRELESLISERGGQIEFRHLPVLSGATMLLEKYGTNPLPAIIRGIQNLRNDPSWRLELVRSLKSLGQYRREAIPVLEALIESGCRQPLVYPGYLRSDLVEGAVSTLYDLDTDSLTPYIPCVVNYIVNSDKLRLGGFTRLMEDPRYRYQMLPAIYRRVDFKNLEGAQFLRWSGALNLPLRLMVASPENWREFVGRLDVNSWSTYREATLVPKDLKEEFWEILHSEVLLDRVHLEIARGLEEEDVSIEVFRRWPDLLLAKTLMKDKPNGRAFCLKEVQTGSEQEKRILAEVIANDDPLSPTALGLLKNGNAIVKRTVLRHLSGYFGDPAYLSLR